MSTFTTPEEAIQYLKSLGMTSEQIVEQVFAVPQPESQVKVRICDLPQQPGDANLVRPEDGPDSVQWGEVFGRPRV